MNLLLDDVRNYLIAQGAVPSGWSVYEGYIPAEVTQVIVVFETPGGPADTLLRENERVAFQTRVRGGRLDYPIVHRVWLRIFNALQDSIMGPGYYLTQAAHHGPMMFSDDLGRTNLVTNWRVLRQRS